ncbi:Senescence-specific cysteine protease SAG39 [Spatholobus suberectus]|nr:Senescence-specific cysteine protease SAG39 [Spatholobus suberectus]
MSSFNQNHYILVLFLVLTVWTSHVMSRRLITSERHEKWMAQYGKIYKDAAEKEKRFKIFKNNVQFIESFNAAGDKPFSLSINQFADLHNEEFKVLLINGNKKAHSVGTATETSFKYGSVTKIPATMDWRKRGAVTPIKDQGTCQSCWAFSTVATIEGLHQITAGELVSLSEQELVDCVKGDSEGCHGGYAEDAFEFIAKKGGIASEAYYPYKGKDRTCKVTKETHGVARIKGYEKVPANSEKALLKAVANQPVSVYIDAEGPAFQFYSSGVFTGKCGTNLNHAVTVVGYGKVQGGTKYWLVKNSWGTEWGEQGYIRMKRNIHAKKGLCGIAANASYPIA